MMKKDTIKVAIDLDGVIWDLVNPWLRQYNLLYQDSVQYEDVLEYDMSKSCVKATRQNLLDILKNDTFWNDVKPFKYSFTYLRKLNENFNLCIATATSHEISKAKINRFLELFPFIHYSQIICIYNKSILDVDWLIDDCEANLQSGKFNKILIDAPYNKNCELELIRAFNLKDVYKILTNYYNN